MTSTTSTDWSQQDVPLKNPPQNIMKKPEASSFQILISNEEIQKQVASVSGQLDQLYDGEQLIIVMIMKGAICLVADLIRNMHVNFSLDFVQCKSYKGKERGQLTVEGLDKLQVEGHHILIVDDIFDSGVTIATVIEAIVELKPKSLRSLVLLNKNVPHKTDYRPDFSLFDIQDRFVVGYGLDYQEQYRGLPGIYALD